MIYFEGIEKMKNEMKKTVQTTVFVGVGLCFSFLDKSLKFQNL